jgi:hypothetical protein
VVAKIDIGNGVNVFESLWEFDNNRELIVHIDSSPEKEIVLKNVIVFPGLTNSHDHLDFNLFPFLGNRIYENSRQWGADIHQQHEDVISKVLAIPRRERIIWGILKNLVSGVTTIVHHGNDHKEISKIGYPVITGYQYLHSIHTEPNWKIKLNLSWKKDVMIHVGEGIDKDSHEEIDSLIRWNLLKHSLIGIHAVGMDEEQSRSFKAIVWCPDSNMRLYGKTAAVDKLKKCVPILFGTDSTLSASVDLWEQLRMSRELEVLTDRELFESLVKTPRSIFSSIGSSLVIADRKFGGAFESFFQLTPEDLLLVTIEGRVMLADKTHFNKLKENEYMLLKVGRSEKWVLKEFGCVVSKLERRSISLPLEVSSANKV